MTDTFPSGFSTPPGAGQVAGESTGDVTTTLAELERKLRELERELTSIGRRRVRPEQAVDTFAASAARAGMDEQTGHGHAGSPTGRLVDERVQSSTRAPLPAQPPPASEATDERPRPSAAQLATLAELRRFRERLERFATELTADYDAMLTRVMAGLSGRPMPDAPEPLEPAAPAAVSQEPLFEGRVELGVGPFYDIGSLSAFEQQVASVPNVTEVSVRRFEASHAVVDLRLSAPVALLSELRRVLDTDFDVRQVAAGRIALSFDEG
ncbi:MAG TPA: hypothetical protein VGY76_00390 [Solirubrobacteraceae bacterium]|nr:hypothetical protein [Solirubrobacteraceae bacterium]